ncbi:hypothetical protein COB55_01755 [Candidatus Wolfebacteria bacterium]|nr:MAG: hypothetical protein COB55_01755 [Candidatus Wolfebacteria bacterium]
MNNANDLIIAVGKLIGQLIPVAFSAALLLFFWGIAKFILSAGSEEKQSEGKSIMLWGVIALFVMTSIWGIVRFLSQSLGI